MLHLLILKCKIDCLSTTETICVREFLNNKQLYHWREWQSSKILFVDCVVVFVKKYLMLLNFLMHYSVHLMVVVYKIICQKLFVTQYKNKAISLSSNMPSSVTVKF